MGQRGQAFHKSRSPEEHQRRKQFGDFVQKWRWALDISQAELALQVDVNQSQIDRYEQGLYLPRRDTLEKLADALRLEDSDRLELLNRAGYTVDPPLSLVDTN